ncbi:hypothetical protein ACFW5W_06765 [Streptomyces sp. NPDC058783]|uniref:hypothetical protein n=1 Tax=Streptomyces sp. NPDC058783 TaxID=3346633 RepID=UPI0036783321
MATTPLSTRRIIARRAEPCLRPRDTTRDETSPVRHRLSDGRRRTVPAGGTIAALAREEQERPGG